MIIVLLGTSGSGKSIIEKLLKEKYGYEKIISCTTRKPRENEINGVDYHFMDNETFIETKEKGLIAEYEEYSQGRLYGTLKTSYLDDKDKVVVLTPNGLRQIKENCPNEEIFSVLIEANLGTRIKRYIDRCGVDKFNFDDKNEISARVERDFGMFCGLEKEVDYIVHNNEGTNICDIAENILREINIRNLKRGDKIFT